MLSISFDGVNDYRLEINTGENGFTPSSAESHTVKIPKNFYMKVPRGALFSVTPLTNAKGCIIIPSESKSIDISPDRSSVAAKSIMHTLIDLNILASPIIHLKKPAYDSPPPRLNYQTVDQTTPEGNVIVGFHFSGKNSDLIFISHERKLVESLATDPHYWWYSIKPDQLGELMERLCDHLEKINKLGEIKFFDVAKKDLVCIKPEKNKADHQHQEINQAPVLIFNETLINQRVGFGLGAIAFGCSKTFAKALDGLSKRQREIILLTIQSKFTNNSKNSNGFFNEHDKKRLDIYNRLHAEWNNEYNQAQLTHLSQPSG